HVPRKSRSSRASGAGLGAIMAPVPAPAGFFFSAVFAFSSAANAAKAQIVPITSSFFIKFSFATIRDDSSQYRLMASILFIHAHPDDAEILAGATVALLAQAGNGFTSGTMTPGDCRSTQHRTPDIPNLRRR